MDLLQTISQKNLTVYEPTRTLISSYYFLLTVPQSRINRFGDASFSRYALCFWNNPLEEVRCAENMNITIY